MSDALRYRLVDEPRPGIFQRFALPPFLVFIVATFLMPWGFLLVAANAVALNGPNRNREIAFAVIPIPIYFAAIVALNAAIDAGLFEVSLARYVFAAALGAGLILLAKAYVSQQQTAELRRYLRQQA